MRVIIVFVLFTYLSLHGFAQGYKANGTSELAIYDTSRRILFGRQADVSRFAFLVRLQYQDNLCSGSIISKDWILSAAHCLNRVPCNLYEIRPAIWPYTAFVRPTQCIVHDRFRAGLYPYDISLLRTPQNFQDERLRSIPLPAPNSVFPRGTPAVITGWGETEQGVYPGLLLTADVRVGPIDWCRSMFAGRVPRRILCTLGVGSTAPGTCFGDSGGPIIINGVIAGISSFVMTQGLGCTLGSPSMHVNVADYLPWIYYHVAPGMDISQIQVQQEIY